MYLCRLDDLGNSFMFLGWSYNEFMELVHIYALRSHFESRTSNGGLFLTYVYVYGLAFPFASCISNGGSYPFLHPMPHTLCEGECKVLMYVIFYFFYHACKSSIHHFLTWKFRGRNRLFCCRCRSSFLLSLVWKVRCHNHFFFIFSHHWLGLSNTFFSFWSCY